MPATISRSNITVQMVGTTLGTFALDVIDGQVTLDDSRNPYVEARITAHLPDSAHLAVIDPRLGIRATVTATISWDVPVKPAQTRTFNLLVHERSVSQATDELSLILESDEALLIDRGNVTNLVDSSAEASQTSLRAIANGVLADIGAALQPGTDDADYTITTNATNLNTSPSVELNATGYTAGGGVMTRVNTWAYAGTWSLQLVASAADSYIQVVITTVVGTVYAVSATARLTAPLSGATDASRSRAIYIVDGIGAIATSPKIANVAGVERLSITFTARQTTTTIRFYAGHAVGTIWWDAFLFSEGPTVYPYFDGAGSVPTDARYSYAWTGTAHGSTSTRTRLDTRSPDMLKQKPGVTDWDFLASLVRPAALRLFSDEARRWYLINPSTYTVPGRVVVSAGANATRGGDEISLQATRDDGSPVWFSGIVVEYAWTEAGVQKVAYDVAGTAQKLYYLRLERPYPGPGEAAIRLKQATGRGRQQQLQSLADLGATPGMELQSSLPATPIQLGTVSAVTWLWSSAGDQHDLMEIRSRGLTDTSATAWILQPDGLAWNEVAVGINWNTYTTPPA